VFSVLALGHMQFQRGGYNIWRGEQLKGGDPHFEHLQAPELK
jgi:hypothetical protein